MARGGALFIAVLLAVTVMSATEAQGQKKRYDRNRPSPRVPGPPAPGNQEWLKGQNMERAIRGEKPLVWDYKLEVYATWWANQRRRDCALMHSNGPYGENIFWGKGKDWQPSEAVSAWVNEKMFYNPASNSCAPSKQCGHYTQIVWRSTTSVGCAKVVCFNRQIFMICDYSPPGNFDGQRPY